MSLHLIRAGTSLLAAVAFWIGAPVASAAPARAGSDAAQPIAAAADVLRIESGRDVDETVGLIRRSVEAKGIRLFDVIDQSALGAEAGIAVRKSTLVLFGNPPLGLQFLRANPYAGLDWPVRMLVSEDADGRVWIAWTDFRFIANRYGLTGLDPQIAMASDVAAAIASEAAR
jgi:uncharacterized protein (DUF302 family)